MKIVILNVLHEPFDKRVFQKIARSLVAAGHELVSICPGEDDGEEAVEGIRFRYIPPAGSKRGRLRSVVRLIRLGRKEPADLYLAPEPESWVAALAIKLTTGRKVIFDMHEHAPSEFAKFFPAVLRPLVSWTTVRFMRFFARYTDLIILTRESFADLWAGLRTPRVTVINTNHLQPKCTELPMSLAEHYADRPTLIHQGVFGDVRGSYQLLEAVKLLVCDFPELRCIVLGDYLYGSEADYRRAIGAAGLETHLILLGRVPFEEVPAHIACANIGLILFQPGPLNHTLAMPHKLFDYMREGKPVIAPGFAVEVTRIVEEAECGILVDVTDPRAIAGAIQSLLHDPAEAERLGRNGRRAVEEKYNWAADEARLLDAIGTLEEA